MTNEQSQAAHEITISQAPAQVATFVNVWETSSLENQRRLIEEMKSEMDAMLLKKGFVSLTILPSLDGKQTVVIGQWQSKEHFERAITNDSQAMESRHRLEQWGKASGNLYRVEAAFTTRENKNNESGAV